MNWGAGVLAASSGLAAGAINAAAGGGTLVTFPALIAAGLGARQASITSSVGLVWGYAGGSLAYRRELRGQGSRLRALALVTATGSVTGALVLLGTPATSFRSVVPYLILVSCALLGAQSRVGRWIARRQEGRRRSGREITWPAHIGVFVSSVYGSYFGAGLGVLLLGVLGILLADNLQRLNALKGLLSLVVSLVGAVVFAVSGQVDWALGAIVAVSAWTGGAMGVAVARRLSPQVLRASVIVFGVGVALALLATSR